MRDIGKPQDGQSIKIYKFMENWYCSVVEKSFKMHTEGPFSSYKETLVYLLENSENA